MSSTSHPMNSGRPSTNSALIIKLWEVKAAEKKFKKFRRKSVQMNHKKTVSVKKNNGTQFIFLASINQNQ